MPIWFGVLRLTTLLYSMIAASSPYLKLNITPPAGKRFSLDKHSYRLNFSKIGPDDYEYDPKKTDEQNEVVVSWRRLETVLGKVGGH